MKVKATLVDRLNRFVFGPQPGDIYKEKCRFKNPFLKFDPSIVEVIETRKCWVQFRYERMHGEFCGLVTEWELSPFVFGFRLQSIEKEEK
jgi:hypothetical protein